MANSESESNDTWSAAQYTKFEKERNRPVMDLLAQIPSGSIRKAVDIGCGPGNSTELLKARFPEAIVSGIDSSPDMISAARKRMPDLSFEISDISTWEGDGPYDLIFANASLQWVPDHAAVLPALVKKLNKNGVLAIQMPDNFEEPAHRAMRSIAADGPWSEKLVQASKRIARENAAWYFKTLRDEVSTVDIWRTTYFHALAGGAEAIVEWFKGTGLRPFLDLLSQEEKTEFLEKYTEEIAKGYTLFPDGQVLLPFPRLFILATR